MDQVIIPDLEDEVIQQHRARAKARGVWLEEELRDMLRRAARPSKEEHLAAMDSCRAMTSPLPPASSVLPLRTSFARSGNSE